MSLLNIDSLSIEEKIGQLFFIGIPTDRVDDVTRELLSSVRPGGICLFARNIRDAEQTRALIDDLRATSAVVPFLSIDQEGGLVDRLRRILGPLPAASKIDTKELAAQHAIIIAQAIRSLGLNMDFAPVVDVITTERAQVSNGLYSRGFGASREDVVELAGEFLDTLASNGVMGCLKHFPGLGASRVDSHEQLPSVAITKDEFESVDLYPYRSLINKVDTASVMVAHAAFPDLDLQETDRDGRLLPASLRFNFVTKLLREELGYDGLVLTDDLEMGAIVNNYGIGEACVLAIEAGEDMVAICAGVDSIRDGFAALLAAVESCRISEERIDVSLSRIDRAKSRLESPDDFDPQRIARLVDEVAQLNSSLNI